MSGAAGYVLRLVCAACICALVNAIGGEGAGSGGRRMIAGAFLVLTALNPDGALELPELDMDSIRQEASAAAENGVGQAKLEEAAIISEACEAYIWNKAAALGAEVAVQVELDENAVPCAVTVTGALSEQAREFLSCSIASDLGLGKEAQRWITPHQSSGSAP